MEQVANYIGGGWHGSVGAETLDVINPATAEVLAQTPLGGQADVDRAAEAAAAARIAATVNAPKERAKANQPAKLPVSKRC